MPLITCIFSIKCIGVENKRQYYLKSREVCGFDLNRCYLNDFLLINTYKHHSQPGTFPEKAALILTEQKPE